ncbi:glyoxalase [Micromonospora olivasterospora]|uniref:Glyoxalase n=1 Tax=Micromonospora olivasterospora TaxID=1880 RepID=A0A562I491_MICOL|nr:glyoxalase [Micromonospora olivasterospora]TWH65505.1 hypothetical protein JD77_00442 [Micromonospora olivasterospora]
MIQHVLLACPRGSEAASRAFYAGLLGRVEKPKPPALAARGGCWFTGYGAELHLGVEAELHLGVGAELHLGVEAAFRPGRKAHVALLRPDLDDLAARLAPIHWGAEEELPGLRRFHTEDAHRNRLEFLAPA